MADAAVQRPRAASQGGFDPLRTGWNLLTNVKFALLLVGVALVCCLLGVVVPQMPAPMRANPEARDAWLALQEADFGAFTPVMDRAGLFDIFHTRWFNGLWLLIVVAVTVCTVSRFRPTARSVHRPQKVVGDRYFDSAHQRASFTHDGGAAAVTAALRKRRYHVEETAERDGTTYLFAEKYAWSQYGTFLSHLALLMLLVGALLTRLAGFDTTLALAEATPGAPVFDKPGPNQIFVTMVNANRGIDDFGNIVDFHSILEVQRGDETVTCKATVNDPCHAFGYKFHQAAFFDDIARLRVTSPTGQLLWDDIVDFNNETVAIPQLRVTNATGDVLFDQSVPQLETDPGELESRSDDIAVSAIRFPVKAGSNEEARLSVAWKIVDGQMRLLVGTIDGDANPLLVGNSVTIGDYTVTFASAFNIPALTVADMPGAASDDGSVALQMTADGAGNDYLLIAGVDGNAIQLMKNQPVTTASGYTYNFTGRVDASGINIKRDPGDTFIWIAVGMAFIGLAITFYVPRRRLWARISPQQTTLAGVAERTTRFSRELRLIGHEAGAGDALRDGDLRRGED
ncbi:hypothetical protein AYO38_00295 [bacterium SCGC AG-212-C10]|nr:hypothetical protein AYO38_00295 [bacterium SCGC AG-212-C10]